MYLQSLRALTDGRELHTMQGVFEAQEYNAAAAFDPNLEGCGIHHHFAPCRRRRLKINE